MIVSFDNKPTTDWGFRVTKIAISQPNPKYTYISVPGRDGDLDYSEIDGVIRYNSRPISVEASCTKSYAEWFPTMKEIAGYIHGAKRKMTVSDDPGYYYLGRFTVDFEKVDEVTGDIVLSGTCDPYKYKTNVTVVEQDIAESGTVTLTNEKKPVIPIITTDAQMQLSFTIDGTEHTASVNSGTHQIPELFLKSGTYPITVTGTGHIKFEYQEGAL